MTKADEIRRALDVLFKPRDVVEMLSRALSKVIKRGFVCTVPYRTKPPKKVYKCSVLLGNRFCTHKTQGFVHIKLDEVLGFVHTKPREGREGYV